jgi:FtsP/CotA-like multicopper oxidase with cupredoxin domain
MFRVHRWLWAAPAVAAAAGAVVAAAVAAALAPAGPAAPSAPAAYDPHSSATAPCGTGTPPPGQFPADLRAPPGGITLTVKQDGSRLCYVTNGIAEAPVIRVRQGDDLEIRLRNEITDPGAIDAVMGAGELKIPNPAVPSEPGFYPVIPGMTHHATGATNLHVHGFAVPPVPPQDDVMTVCTDPAVGSASCRQREFTYHYHLPKDMPEGLYWYHPHVHGEVQAQLLMGLSGAIVVEGSEDDARRTAGISERVLIVRQMQDVDAGKPQDASITAAPAGPPQPEPPMAAIAVDTAHELLCAPNSGIDEISLNGAPVPLGEAPDAALAQLSIPAGTKQLWRVLNAATDAFLDLALVDESGKLLPFEIVARDGAPLTDDAGQRLHPPPTTEPQLVPPSGRVELLVSAPPLGTKAYFITRAVDTGCAGDRVPERRLAVVTASPATAPVTKTSLAAPSSLPDVFTGLMSRQVDKRRVIALAEYPRPGFDNQTDFYIMERRPGAVMKPFEMDGPPMITVKAGNTEEWTIENWTNELHAFHIHQVHFRVLEIDGKSIEDPPLLDVVTIPYATATGYHSKEGPVRPGRVVIKVTFPESLAGDIPFHCHLVDHEDNGMMAVLRVVPSTVQMKKADLALDALIRSSICRPRQSAMRARQSIDNP